MTNTAADLAADILQDDLDKVDHQDDRELLDGMLRGGGEKERPFREIVGVGGKGTLVVLFSLNMFDEFDRAALATIGPEIKASLGISNTVLGLLITVGAISSIVAAIPLGYLADRVSRRLIIAVSSLVWGIAAFLGAVAGSAWQLGLTRVFNGAGKGTEAVQRSMLADTYPIDGRGRIFSAHNFANPIGNILGPLLAGALVVGLGGTDSWRLALAVMAAPALVLALVALRLKEPKRGQYETLAVHDSHLATAPDQLPPPDPSDDEEIPEEPPVSFSAGFERLKKIRTYYSLMCALGVLGLALSGTPAVFNLMLEDKYGLDALQRAYVATGMTVGGMVGLVIGGMQADRMFKKNPPRVMVLVGLALMAFGVLYPISFLLPNAILFTAYHAVVSALISIPLAAATPLISAVIPYRLRGLGFSVVGIYTVLFGGLGGALLTGLLSDKYGEVAALVIVLPPSCAIGGLIVLRAARFVREDISLVVEEMLEEEEERARAKEHGDGPILQVRHIDFSYGKVQVLFDCGFDLQRGETLALLGTNGAGKSTLLRAVSGLGMPDRGVVRLDGTTITYLDAEDRVARGVVQLPGGKAIFPGLTVGENLVVGANSFVWDQRKTKQKLSEVLDMFPRLTERVDQRAGLLSGGEQQQLALAKALLLEPKVLCIDELSLGPGACRRFGAARDP